MSDLGNLYVVAGPSGCGKTSLVAALIAEDAGLRVSISYTTRPPRQQDQDGVDYFFKSEQVFLQMATDEVFLEHAKVFGYFYGTSREWVQSQLEQSVDVILEIDWQGARQVKQCFPQVITLFVLPPSLEVLEQRLRRRKQDPSEVIARRMSQAQQEMDHHAEFDYLLLNEHFDALVVDACHIMRAQRLVTARQVKKMPDILEDLLKRD